MRVCPSAEKAIAAVRADAPDVVVLDVRLPGMDGLTALTRVRELAPECEVVVITAHGNLSTAVQAVEGGAFDYLTKPFDLSQAMDVVARALLRRSRKAPAERTVRTDEIVGRSPAMQTVFRRIALVAPSAACVLITGESGTGKELVARAIHRHSLRRHEPFVPVHVAAMSPTLVESELFGHAKGAFTGATAARAGLLELASGGTIFLDELGDIPPGVQAKLLRVLEYQEVLPVGSGEPVRIDVRILSATHRNLREQVAAGEFRHDLLFRLNAFEIAVPSLAERGGDLRVLAEHFLESLAPGSPPIPPQTIDALESRGWPGNVRELRNAVEHAAILARGSVVLPVHFPASDCPPGPIPAVSNLDAGVRDWVRRSVASSAGAEPAELYRLLLDEIEPVLLDEVLSHVRGNRLTAARWLGLARGTLRKMMAEGRPVESPPEPPSETP